MRTWYQLCGIILALVMLSACAGRAASPPASDDSSGAGVRPSPTSTADTSSGAPKGNQPVAPTEPQPGQAQPTAQPTAAPDEPTEPAGTPERSIVLSAPQPGQTVSSPLEVSGSVSVTPFEATLNARVYDGQGQLLAEAPITLASEMGQPGTFSGQIPFEAPAGTELLVEVAERSAKDGSVVVSAQVNVVAAGEPAEGSIELPAAGARVTLPLHFLARFDREPGEELVAAVRWANGVELAQSFPLLQGEDGRGLLIGNLNWQTESEPPQPAETAATFEVRDRSGAVLAQRPLEVLRWDDPETRVVKLYWVLGEQLEESTRRIPKTEAIGAAALEELLWGPDPSNLAGFETALPSPQEVLSFQGREADWGPRVRLLGLAIKDGVATADFSQELRAYGGGALRVGLISQQIERTLKQFPSVSEVRIAIEGQVEGVLEP